jgi:uncharacterized protein YkwD
MIRAPEQGVDEQGGTSEPVTGARRAWRHLGAIVAAAMAPGVSTAAASEYALARTRALPCPSRALEPNGRDGATIARAAICLINVERARRHLPRLRANRALARVASGQSSDMVRGDYFADRSISGLSPLERMLPVFGVARAASAELLTAQNIGWGTGSYATPAGIVKAWMNSPPHRRILLGGFYREAGVGVTASLPAMLRRGSNGATYVLELAALGG